MAQDITATIDGIRRSVETVGKSGREDVYLDNVSFRIGASADDVPLGSSVREAEERAPDLFDADALAVYDHELGQIFVSDPEEASNIFAL
jgi:hypothetical protein